MIKREELTNPQSCMSRAKDDEMTFVLLGRDRAAPVAIRAWVAERLRLNKNTPDDEQIIEALSCAATMEVLRIPEPTEAGAACPVTAAELREFIKRRRDCIPFSDHWYAADLAECNRMETLADWIASQPTPAAPVTVTREQVYAAVQLGFRPDPRKCCGAITDEITKLLEGR